ncbi:MAG: hypothetical protein V3V14_01240 [Saprospiraceae bacterium]
MKRILKRIKFNFYLLQKINWLRFIKLQSKNSETVVMVWPRYPNNFFNYMSCGTFENDFALVNAVMQKGQKFKLVLGKNRLSKIKNKQLYFNLSGRFKNSFESDYSKALLDYQSKLLSQGNKLVPSHEDTHYWENKLYMHKKFEELNISHPQTIIVDTDHPAPIIPTIPFPFLFKPAHSSGSIGIVKVNNQTEYKDIIENTEYTEYMLQEWIDMRRDLRLIYVGDELLLHYWRINESDEWKPTSTGHGSSVGFETLPEQWMDFLYKEYKKLNIKTGAFDVTWRDDDLSTKPLILEVSPSYMPNPAPSGKFKNKPYKTFKNQLFGKDAYFKKYIDLVFKLKNKLIDLK